MYILIIGIEISLPSFLLLLSFFFPKSLLYTSEWVFITVFFSFFAWFLDFYETLCVMPGLPELTSPWNCSDRLPSGYFKINIGECRNVWLNTILINDLSSWLPPSWGHSFCTCWILGNISKKWVWKKSEKQKIKRLRNTIQCLHSAITKFLLLDTASIYSTGVAWNTKEDSTPGARHLFEANMFIGAKLFRKQSWQVNWVLKHA